MKRILTILTVVAAMAMVRAPEAKAGDDAWVALAGFVGGAILTSAAQSHHGHSTTHYVTHGHHAGGHYEYQSERVWVPGYWESYEDDCGRVRRTWHKGYHRYETVKVWVPHRAQRRVTYRYSSSGRRHCRY